MSSSKLATRPEASPDRYVELSGVHFGYKERAIISGVDMQIKKGEVTALMGGSGSGKTTLLRLITGQVKAQQGSVFLMAKMSAR